MLQTSLNEEELRGRARRDGVTHLSTGVAIVRGGKILMARRAQHDFLGGQFELPGGGVDAGETITEGALREVTEETGLTVKLVLGTFDGFDYSTDKKPKVRQINFLVEANDGDVVLDPNEHDAYEWLDEDAIDSVQMSPNMQRCVLDAFACLKEVA